MPLSMGIYFSYQKGWTSSKYQLELRGTRGVHRGRLTSMTTLMMTKRMTTLIQCTLVVLALDRSDGT